ncbi:MAG: hypothetical protein AAGC55_25595 [Myxococcota bacterium]
MKINKFIPISVALSGLLVAGCLQDNDELSQEDYDDTAAAVSGLVTNSSGGDVGSMEYSLNLATGVSASSTYSSFGLNYEYLVACSDEAGTVQDVCNADTATAELTVNWSGDLVVPGYEGSVARTGDWALTSVKGPIAEFNGNGTFDVATRFESLFRPVMRDMTLSYAAQYDAVQLDTATGQILSGEITYDISAMRSVVRGDNERDFDYEMEADLTFNGDGMLTLVLDRDYSYTVDISSGAVSSDQ